MKKQRKYKPKPITLSPLLSRMVIRSVTQHDQPASREKQEILLARFHSAIYSIAAGSSPNIEDWYDLSDAINTVEIMTKRGIVSAADVMPTVSAAVTAMRDCGVRYREGHSMRMSGQGLQAVREVVAIYGDVMSELSEADMAMLQCDTQEFVAHILSGEYKGSREVVTV